MSKNEFDALLLKKLQDEAFEYDPKSWEQLSGKLDVAIPKLDETLPFDTLLVQKLQEDPIDYNPKSWQNLSQKLGAEEEKEPVSSVPFRKWGIAIGTAAAVCLLVALAVTLNRSNKTIIENGSSLVKQQNNSSSKTTEQNINKIPSLEEETNKPALTAASEHSNQAYQNQRNQKQRNQPENNTPSFLNQQNEQNVTSSKETIHQPGNASQKDIDRFNKDMTAPIKKEQPSDAEIAQRNANQNWPQDYLKSNDEVARKPKTNVALGGGVNYGNLNTGYTGAVTVKRKIGGDFFVDGTVAMLYNNNANNVAVNNGPSLNNSSNLASKPTVSSISSPALAPIQRLYYVQFNPSVGYQIEDNIALSLGGDVQQMLGGRDEVVQPQNDNTKVFPTLDVGLTTKTEFTISPNLQAGLVYREGLNNLVKGSDAGTYVNRRYLQVQFKYNIPVGK